MSTLVLVLLCLFLPPVAVLVKEGLGLHFIINLLLLIFTVWIGAVIHAMVISFRQA